MINCNLRLSAVAYFNEGNETKLCVLREEPQKENNKVGQSTHGGLCQRIKWGLFFPPRKVNYVR